MHVSFRIRIRRIYLPPRGTYNATEQRGVWVEQDKRDKRRKYTLVQRGAVEMQGKECGRGQ